MQHLFEIVKSNKNIEKDVQRLVTLSANTGSIVVNRNNCYSLFDFMRIYGFKYWSGRGRCVDLADYFDVIGYDNVLAKAHENFDSLSLFMELIYSFWLFVKHELTYPTIVYGITGLQEFDMIKYNLDSMLADYGLKAAVDKRTKMCIVEEEHPVVDTIAEIVPEDITLDVIKYYHRTSKGDLKEKRIILQKLANYLEPKRAYYSTIDKALTEDIFFVVNAYNIRHNNSNQDDSHYTKDIEKFSDSDFEDIYDCVFELILLLIQEDSNKVRKTFVKTLRETQKSNT